MKRAFIVALAVALCLLPLAPAGADPGANQLVSWSALCNAVTAGTLHWSGSTPANCSSTPNRIITWPQFTSNVTHTGTGCGSGNPLPTWGALLTCRGAGTTVTSQAWSATGSLYTTDGTTCFPGGGAATVSFSTPPNTVAPTTAGTQVKLAFSSIAQYTGDLAPTTGTGISYSLTAPGGGTVASGSLSNGSTAAPSYFTPGAPAGSYVWTISGLGSETCTGASLKTVHNNTAEQFSATASWSQ